ncbi:MAG: hypothetical protein PUG07_00170, partial [Ruminococcus sp.]|nr:hypothetical protein [Ruminococcus sp.]
INFFAILVFYRFSWWFFSFLRKLEHFIDRMNSYAFDSKPKNHHEIHRDGVLVYILFKELA